MISGLLLSSFLDDVPLLALETDIRLDIHMRWLVFGKVPWAGGTGGKKGCIGLAFSDAITRWV